MSFLEAELRLFNTTDGTLNFSSKAAESIEAILSSFGPMIRQSGSSTIIGMEEVSLCR